MLTGAAAVRGRDDLGHARGRAAPGDRLDATAGRDAGRLAAPAAALPRARTRRTGCTMRLTHGWSSPTWNARNPHIRSGAARHEREPRGFWPASRLRSRRLPARWPHAACSRSHRRTDTANHIVRFAIEPPPEVMNVSSVAVSADGRFAVYEAQVEGEYRFFLRRFDALESQPRCGNRGRPRPVPLAGRGMDRVRSQREACTKCRPPAATRSSCATCKAVPARRGPPTGGSFFRGPFCRGCRSSLPTVGRLPFSRIPIGANRRSATGGRRHCPTARCYLRSSARARA